MPKDSAKWRCHLSRSQRAGCDLIKQRLKQMEVALIDKRHLNGRSAERLRSQQASEAAAKNEDAVRTAIPLGANRPTVARARIRIVRGFVCMHLVLLTLAFSGR